MNNLYTIQQRVVDADPDRARAARLADAAARERLFWLYAFHLELAKVPEIVSEPMIGDIRYQWWRDAVDEIYTGRSVRSHEITTPFAKVCQDAALPRFWIDRLINGRVRDLDPQPFAGIDEARDYCAQTSGVLMQLAAGCVSSDFDEDAVMRAGEVWGLTGLLRAYGYYHGSMLSGVSFDDLLKITRQLYQEVREHKFTPELLPAIAYTGLVPTYLKSMSRAGFDPKTEATVINPLQKQIRLFMVSVTGRL